MGNFSHNGLTSIEIDVFLREGNLNVFPLPQWAKKHVSITAEEFSGYIIREFCYNPAGKE
jgi:hypothetical protein